MSCFRLRSPRSPRTGFTLVELLVTIAIIAIVASLLLPAVTQARGLANNMRCGSNLRQVGLAFFAYTADNNGFYPSLRDQGTPGINTYWVGLIAPYADATRGANGSQLRTNGVFRGCPLYKPGNGTHLSYAMNRFLLRPESGAVNALRANGTPLDASTFSHFIEARITWPSNRALLSERDGDDNLWGATSINYRHNKKTRASVLFCDGHIESQVRTKLFPAFDNPRLYRP